MTTDLSINGTATMVSNSWDIHFDNLVVQNGSVEIGTPDKSYARIDNPPDFPGCFTDIADKP